MTDVTPAALRIQVEAVTTGKPTSESVAQSIAASTNFCLDGILPVGSVASSLLTEAQYQTEINSTKWVLADGRSAAGTRYQTITGQANIPDLRGIFLRARNNGRNTTDGDPRGELPLGSYTLDQIRAHNHGITENAHNHIINAVAPTALSGPNYAGNGGSQTNANHIADAIPGFNVGALTGTAIDTGHNPIRVTAANTDNSVGSETNPKYVVVNHFIRIN